MEMIIGFLQSGFSAVIPFIVLLGILIFVHELGHFAVAKYFGVRVEVFSLGFGKKLFSYKKGDTTYCISLIPLGGYVKMFGDEIGANLPEKEKKFSFTHKPVSQRIAIVLAGPLMNLFFAILVFFVVAMVGEDVRAPKVGDIALDSQAHSLGFRSGDTILKVNEASVSTWDQFQHLISQSTDRALNIQVQRESSTLIETVTATPTLNPNPNILSLDTYVGDIPGLTSTSRASIVGVRSGSVAQKLGFKTGDLIKSINGTEIKFFRQLENAMISLAGRTLTVVVERRQSLLADKSELVTLEIEKSQVSSIASLGLESPDLYLADIVKGSPAERARLRVGDRILAVNGQEVSKWEDVLNKVKTYSGSDGLIFTIQRSEGTTEQFTIIPEMTSHLTAQGSEEKRYTIGIRPWIMTATPDIIIVKSDNLVAGFIRGLERTGEVTTMTVVSFLRLIQGMISPKTIGGVISIGQVASESFKMGLSQFLIIMGFISINLFVLNLLPIPVLDGGHLLFYSIEALRGAPVSMRKMEIAQQIGLVMLMSLMAFALFNDFTRIFGN
jgi:regulator of sigma E protease